MNLSVTAIISTIKGGYTEVEGAIASGLAWLRNEAIAAIPGLQKAEADVQSAETTTAEAGAIATGLNPGLASTVSGIELGEVILTKFLGLLVAGAEAMADGGVNLTLDKNVVTAGQALLHPVASAATVSGAPQSATQAIVAAAPIPAPAAPQSPPAAS